MSIVEHLGSRFSSRLPSFGSGVLLAVTVSVPVGHDWVVPGESTVRSYLLGLSLDGELDREIEKKSLPEGHRPYHTRHGHLRADGKKHTSPVNSLL